MDVVVAGSHGLIGTALVARAARGAATPCAGSCAATPPRPDEIRWDPDAGRLDPARPGRRRRRRQPRRRRRRRPPADRGVPANRAAVSRTRTTSLLLDDARGPERRSPGPAPGVRRSARTATRGDDVLDESSARGERHVLRRASCAGWEAVDRRGRGRGDPGGAPAQRHRPDPAGRGARPAAADRPGRARRAARVAAASSGAGSRSPDEVGAIVHLLTAPVAGPVNLTSPHPATQAEVVRRARARAAPAGGGAGPRLRAAVGARRVLAGHPRLDPRRAARPARRRLRCSGTRPSPTPRRWVAAGAPVPSDPRAGRAACPDTAARTSATRQPSAVHRSSSRTVRAGDAGTVRSTAPSGPSTRYADVAEVTTTATSPRRPSPLRRRRSVPGPRRVPRRLGAVDPDREAVDPVPARAQPAEQRDVGRVGRAPRRPRSRRARPGRRRRGRRPAPA